MMGIILWLNQTFDKQTKMRVKGTVLSRSLVYSPDQRNSVDLIFNLDHEDFILHSAFTQKMTIAVENPFFDFNLKFLFKNMYASSRQVLFHWKDCCASRLQSLQVGTPLERMSISFFKEENICRRHGGTAPYSIIYYNIFPTFPFPWIYRLEKKQVFLKTDSIGRPWI